MSISEEVIVAGAKAMDTYWGGRYAPDEVEELRGEITAILEAVTPMLKAEALEDAAGAAEGMHEPTAPDCQEWADWLRARAAAGWGEG